MKYLLATMIEGIRRWLGFWPRCPKCGRKFNDWFVWPTKRGLIRYCYPCWDEGCGKVITEDDL